MAIAIEDISPICGKPERMKVHLKTCKFIPEDDRTVALLSAQTAESRSKPQSQTHDDIQAARNRTRRLLEALTREERQAEFTVDLCKFLVAIQAPWSILDDPTFREFIHTWVWADIVIPTCDDMGRAYLGMHKTSDSEE